MRILVAHAFYRHSGGEDRYVMRQIDLLRGRHEVRLLAQHNDELAPDVRTAVKMVYSRVMKQRAERVIADFRPDIVHLHNAYPALGPAVQLAARQLGTPLVMTVHNHRLRCPNGLMFTEGAICRRCEHGLYASAVLHRCFSDIRQSSTYATALWIHRFAVRLHETVSLFIAPSLFMRDRLIRWGFRSERTRAVPNPVDPEQVVSAPGTFGVYVGRLAAEKGVDVLLRALAHAGDPPFRIVGDGPLRRPLERLARELRLTRTAFEGKVNSYDVHRMLAGSRYLVMPSISEEVGPLAPLEAMAHGRTIIASALGALNELVRDGAGFATPPGDHRALAVTIRRLIDEPDLAAASGQKAWQLCKEAYSTRVHLERLEDAYASVLSASNAP
ncbi:MAG TPA: glycosyltransferase family 4 protein [Actinomycetota bacterium]|jgi:glycosyltransferase involved in cell wall biosynthesis|nr:glycosyltransferase family 4 protein [Actinomycetota bacterium]